MNLNKLLRQAEIDAKKDLKNINLCLSNRCNATCIWCPSTRGTNHNYDMPWITAKKIIDELADPNYPFETKMIHLSENGEAIYNPDFLKICRYIKEKLPNTAVNLLSNFGMMSSKLSKTLLQENLLSSIQVNIDGHDAESYTAVKGIPYESVISNVIHFVNHMKDINPKFDFCINVMPAFEYAVTVASVFKRPPEQVDGEVPYSDFELVEKSLRNFLSDDIRIRHSKSGLWAERRQVANGLAPRHPDTTILDCPMLERVEEEAFIAPNGDWYPCCLDDNQDIVLGNVNENTLLEIFNNDTRKKFIKLLKTRQWEEIGYPCNTVECCQIITLPKEIYTKEYGNYTAGSKVILKQPKDSVAT
tara:strand:- start:2616 stop:3695 length:1080 start_codon:yes stop_codon:yes gene_type:complete